MNEFIPGPSPPAGLFSFAEKRGNLGSLEFGKNRVYTALIKWLPYHSELPYNNIILCATKRRWN
ncbi:hypothetical protein VL06_01390 [Rossellomorea marisflavi]|uniref:Uncharacterized protein n=1 Tax=Rossellomorea marisflavi TaxID=189381 RepID=A0A0J5V4M3_9BACI|nr:hypothetical protein VL03_16660 [Rossellomorea marisflavi]KML08148.1 hypothetical protein VL06_01390 [Rossellomorea marisflavi]KZE44397.1 hypothetical protein AV649_07140 [Rossellomorea marisflavi]